MPIIGIAFDMILHLSNPFALKTPPANAANAARRIFYNKTRAWGYRENEEVRAPAGFNPIPAAFLDKPAQSGEAGAMKGGLRFLLF